MDKLQQCGISVIEKGDIDWVQCSTCFGWYHCACIGIALKFFHDNQDFYCCKKSHDNPMYVLYYNTVHFSCSSSIIILYTIRVMKFPVLQRKNKKIKQIILMQSDLQSLYPGNGLSDGVLDFYLRYNFLLVRLLCYINKCKNHTSE